MITENIWRAAALLVKRHGAEAAMMAAQHADELLAAGDFEGCAFWKQILAAVGELARIKPADNERVN